MTVSYSAAAPFLRERALYTAYSLENQRTQKALAQKVGMLFAYIHALEMVVSAHPDESTEVAEPAPPPQAAPALANFLKNEAKMRELFPTIADEALANLR